MLKKEFQFAIVTVNAVFLSHVLSRLKPLDYSDQWFGLPLGENTTEMELDEAVRAHYAAWLVHRFHYFSYDCYSHFMLLFLEF